MIIIALISIVIICLAAIIFFEDVLDNPTKNSLAILLMVSSIGLGVKLERTSGVSGNKPINPKIRIECVDGQCDTTYIYKEK